MTPDVLDAISLVGGVLIFCVGWNILWNEKKIRVANLLPSLVVAIVWTLAKGALWRNPNHGFLTHEALANIAETTLKNLDDYFAGAPLGNEICYRCLGTGGAKGGNCPRRANGRCHWS